MLVFWVVVVVALTLLLANAWRLDRRAARKGKVLVAVKAGLGRTRFIAVDREEREAELRAALIAEADRERAERRAGPTNGGYARPAELMSSLLGFGRRRGR